MESVRQARVNQRQKIGTRTSSAGQSATSKWNAYTKRGPIRESKMECESACQSATEKKVARNCWPNQIAGQISDNKKERESAGQSVTAAAESESKHNKLRKTEIADSEQAYKGSEDRIAWDGTGWDGIGVEREGRGRNRIARGKVGRDGMGYNEKGLEGKGLEGME